MKKRIGSDHRRGLKDDDSVLILCAPALAEVSFSLNSAHVSPSS